MWLNIFPTTDGIYTTTIPINLVTGPKVNKKNFHIKLVSYIQTHEENANGMGSRTIGAISIRATCNTQG